MFLKIYCDRVELQPFGLVNLGNMKEIARGDEKEDPCTYLRDCTSIDGGYGHANSLTLCVLFQRPPGPIPSSMLGLEAYTGAVDDFGFEDYLNAKQNGLNSHMSHSKIFKELEPQFFSREQRLLILQ